MKSIKVSDIVTTDHINSWCPGDVVFIGAGTGKGKSYFVQNALYYHCKAEGKKILYLVNRTYLLNKFAMVIKQEGKRDVITLQTYQYYEANHMLTLGEFDYIVSDEAHFFFADAKFNQKTDICFNKIIVEQQAIKVFMTATGIQILGYLRSELKLTVKDYVLKANFDFIDELIFYHSDDCLESIIDMIIKSGDKGLLFINNGQKMLDLYEKYEQYAMFNVSQHNKSYVQHNDPDQMNLMLQEEKFHTQLLFTTTALDNGINLVDKDIKYIVCDISDTMSLIQAIGRKRIQGHSDKFCLYVRSISNKQLAGRERVNKRSLEHAEYLKIFGTHSYITNYYRREKDRSGAIYDCICEETGQPTKRVNDQRYWKIKLDAREARKMINMGAFGYCEYIKKTLHQPKYDIWSTKKQNETIVQYLQRNVGRRYYKEDKTELIDKLNITDSERRKHKSYTSLNNHFHEHKMPFIILSKVDTIRLLADGTKNKNRNSHYWEIVDSIST